IPSSLSRSSCFVFCFFFFFFTDSAASVIYSLSLHDALPIFSLFLNSAVRLVSVPLVKLIKKSCFSSSVNTMLFFKSSFMSSTNRSEEHTSELQSRENLVCRLLLEKKKTNKKIKNTSHNSSYK